MFRLSNYLKNSIHNCLTTAVFFYRPRTVHEGSKGEEGYSSALSLTSALDGGG